MNLETESFIHGKDRELNLWKKLEFYFKKRVLFWERVLLEGEGGDYFLRKKDWHTLEGRKEEEIRPRRGE